MSAQVYAYYTATSDNSNTVTTAALIGALSSAYQATTGFAEASAVFTQDQSSILAAASGGSQGDNVPAAYLNYLFLDEDHTFVRGGYTSIAEGANMHQLMELNNLSAFEQPGYVMVYVSYEGVEHYVDFDDLTVTHTESAVVQADNYYPFGLTFNSYQRVGNQPNRFLFNGGSELQNALNLGYYQTLFRLYDPALGRFTAVDPLADFFPGINSYSFALNNPILYGDPDGLGPLDFLKRLFRGFVGDGASKQAKKSQRKNKAKGQARGSRGKGRKRTRSASTSNRSVASKPSPQSNKLNILSIPGFNPNPFDERRSGLDFDPLPEVNMPQPEPSVQPRFGNRGPRIIPGETFEFTRSPFGDEQYVLPKAILDDIFVPLASYLLQNNGSTVEITFNTGIQDLNAPLPKNRSMTGLQLLRKRAEAIKRALLHLGVDPSRVKTKGRSGQRNNSLRIRVNE